MDELCWHFGLSDPVGEAANILDDLHMKSGDKISTYNVDFMHYASQLGWGNSVLCHHYYQGLPNWIQDPISTQEQGGFSLFLGRDRILDPIGKLLVISMAQNTIPPT